MSSRSLLLPLLALLAATACDDTPKISAKDRAEGLYVKGSTEYLQGQFDQALLSFNEMKQYAPDDPRLPAAIGEIYLSMGKFEEALASFEAALLIDPKRSTTWSRLGFIQAQLGKDEEARASLLKAVALYPQDFNALEQLGELHLKRQEQEEAVRHFTLAAQASPDTLKPALLMRAVDVLQSGNRHAEALALLQKSTVQGIRSPEVLTTLGDEQVRAGHLDEAATAYRDAATRSPKDPSLWELVGEIRLRQGKTDDALAAFRESLRVKNRAIVHVSLARLHLARQDRKAAEEELALALESVSGSDVRELSELAELLVTFGRKPDALRILSALAAEPDNAGEVPLQLRTARLASELKDAELVKAACARVASKGSSAVSCP
ncbi:tetratricopeptide repeat protein [Stigmatella aurantiaca]|uniref:Tetratricopeptide repeat family n=1 Tax=Stigmatella aurantiaca (strain DW4/3-1) TaxID=378806 RepID=Q08Y98_STIAD|nr:tetratricopeptide repeat protein [Stigmatella aurantiaca]ADO72581.1 Tetratricopeptide repeat protein [Stigmatella aurantiaca DW4/3-1]EAU65476.1 tetratricopeptide repeat family [Stigmatella aurantiaca DW4/3-1]